MLAYVRSVAEAVSEVLCSRQFPLELVIPDYEDITRFAINFRDSLDNSSYKKFVIRNASTEQDKILYVRER
jgi:hypothetical protein